MKKPRLTRRRMVVGVIAAGMLAGIGLALRPRPVVVDVATVDEGPLIVTFAEEGRTHLPVRTTCTAPVTGNLHTLALRAGDPVRAGDVLFQVTPAAPPLVDVDGRAQLSAMVRGALARVDEARASVRGAEAARHLALEEASRLERLEEADAVSASAVEDAYAARDRAEAALDAAHAAHRAAVEQLAQARVGLHRATGHVSGGGPALDVRAPWSGVVLRVVRDHDGLVAAGEPVLQLADTARLEVRVPIHTDDAVELALGTAATVTDWGGPPLMGRVARVEPQAFTRISALGVEEQRTFVVVEVEVPDSARTLAAALGDGWAAQVAFERWRGARVVRVPVGGLVRSAQGWVAFVMEGGRVRRRMVIPGHRTADTVEVLQGLSVGERVVLYPADRVDEGVRVRERAAARAHARAAVVP